MTSTVAKAGDGAEIYYEAHGSGPVIVMSAGMGGGGAFWTPQLAALSAATCGIQNDPPPPMPADITIAGPLPWVS